MITRATRIQVIAFVILTVLSIGYVGFRYADFERIFGGDSYSVRMQLADSGGIFTDANVTYRGVTVGQVGALSLTPRGVEVELRIDDDAAAIPADLHAAVLNGSAIGEQYVDLVPTRREGPVLEEGSVIPMSRTSVPVPVEELLYNLDTLLRSVPLDSLRTVVDELGQGFAGTGPDLQNLLDSSRLLTDEAVDSLPETLTLISDGRTVLETQRASSAQIVSFSRDLRLLAEQLRRSDPDLRRLINTAPRASTQVIALLAESGTQLGQLIADLLTTTRVFAPRLDGLEQILVTYPVVTGGSFTTAPGDGTGHLGLVLNLFDPPPCTQGYEDTPQREGTDESPVALNRDARCTEPRGSEINVRGSHNAPRPDTGVPAEVPAPNTRYGVATANLPGARPAPDHQEMSDLTSVLR